LDKKTKLLKSAGGGGKGGKGGSDLTDTDMPGSPGEEMSSLSGGKETEPPAFGMEEKGERGGRKSPEKKREREFGNLLPQQGVGEDPKGWDAHGPLIKEKKDTSTGYRQRNPRTSSFKAENDLKGSEKKKAGKA